MKTIKKSPAPCCLKQAESLGLTWDGFVSDNHEAYLSVRQQALDDQACECAYTGLWLGKGTKQCTHIDHFHKKAIYQDETFCWNNLFAAAKNLSYGADHKDKQIHGPRTIADEQYKKFLPPLEANLEDYFWYRQDGFMEPNDHLTREQQSLAQRTIEVYNLNAPDLRQRRQGIIQQISVMDQMGDEDIRICMESVGFSFLIDFELKQRT